MVPDDDERPGFKLAGQVLQRLEAEGLEPYPANYTLWHAFYSNCLPDLSRTVERLEKEGLPFTQVRCDDLFQRYFSSDAEARAIREAGERTQRSLNHLLEVLEQASADTGHYGKTLGGFTDVLAAPPNLDQLRLTLDAVTSETRTIADEHERLLRRLKETGSELTRLRAKLHTARRELMIDSLTGIANRKGFENALNEAIATAVAEGQPLSLLMIDIDYFKLFNDRHGHLVGDMVLRLAARVLTDSVKGRDTVARFGGEEFTVILPRTGLADALVVADHIRESISRRQIMNRNRNENFGTITLSVGVSQYHPHESFHNLIARADAALYEAKRGGRNRVCEQRL